MIALSFRPNGIGASAAMNYDELTRRELQALCKEHGLPANKTNAVMADSLASLLSDSNQSIRTRAPVSTPPTTKWASKTRSLSKPERLETSLAALILASSEKPRGNGRQDTLLNQSRDLPLERELFVKPALVFLTPTKLAHSTLLPNTTPLRRRKKTSVSILQPGAEDTTPRDATQVVPEDSNENLRLQHEEIEICMSQAITGSTHESQFTPVRDVARDIHGSSETRKHILQDVAESRTDAVIELKEERQFDPPHELEPLTRSSALDQDCQTESSSTQECVQHVLSPLLRVTSNVDTLIKRATGMLEKFEQWKVNIYNEVVHNSSSQTQLCVKYEQPCSMNSSFDKKNNFSESPCKSMSLRIRQAGYIGLTSPLPDRKEGILRDLVSNVNTQRA